MHFDFLQLDNGQISKVLNLEVAVIKRQHLFVTQ